MPYGWEGEKVRLVPLDKARHLDNAMAWLNDPEITAWTLIGDWPVGRLAEEDWFDAMSRLPPIGLHEKVTFAVETLAGEHIGFSGLHAIDWHNKVATTGTILGRRDLWGQGYGSDAANVRTRFAFEVLGLRMLLSDVMADNAGSIRMLKKAGYTEVGRIPRRIWKRGAWRDVVMLCQEAPLGERRAPRGKQAANAGERLLPAGERLLPAGEWLLAAGERLLPVGERLLPVGERLIPVRERLIPAGENTAPLSAQAANAGDGALPSVRAPPARAPHPLPPSPIPSLPPGAPKGAQA